MDCEYYVIHVSCNALKSIITRSIHVGLLGPHVVVFLTFRTIKVGVIRFGLSSAALGIAKICLSMALRPLLLSGYF